jgi:hypothetical protein
MVPGFIPIIKAQIKASLKILDRLSIIIGFLIFCCFFEITIIFNSDLSLAEK